MFNSAPCLYPTSIPTPPPPTFTEVTNYKRPVQNCIKNYKNATTSK